MVNANYMSIVLIGLAILLVANFYQMVRFETVTRKTSANQGSILSFTNIADNLLHETAFNHGPSDKRRDSQQITDNEVNSISLTVQERGKSSIDVQQKHVIEPPGNKDLNSAKIVSHSVDGLSCAKYGGPEDEFAQEMVYWRDIPTDATYVSPLKPRGDVKYLTFEPDRGGWNNIRMAMETTVMLALSMGRTLVLPPEQHMYLLGKKGAHGKHKTSFGFGDFYHFRSIESEHGGNGGMRVLTFDEFLKDTHGKLRSATDNYQSIVFPPENRTEWSEVMGKNFHRTENDLGVALWSWMRQHMTDTYWRPPECVAYFPADRDNDGEVGQITLAKLEDELKVNNQTRWKRPAYYSGRPTPVDGSTKDRLEEMLTDRHKLCVYNKELQQRQDWHSDLWTKRFVRDHLRYVDEIQCTAARVVHAVRQISKSRGDPTGSYDSMHIRRGDFQYKDMHMEAEFIYENNTRSWMLDNRTVFIATDEKKKDYFEPLKKHYHLLFLSDFQEALGDINTNFYGMIDQLVASRGDTFTGAYYSTFTGFINRMRGYHAQNAHGDGWEQGAIKSFYFTPVRLMRFRKAMHQYNAISQPFWAQEFHSAWRDIDHDITP